MNLADKGLARVSGWFSSSGKIPEGRATGSEIEVDPSYEPQTTCDPQEKPGATALMKILLATFPGTRNLGISRECSVIREIPSGVSEHKEGRALDWGVSALDPTEKAMADSAIEQLTASDKYGNTHALARRLGIMYIVWNKRLWAPKSGWRAYTDSPNPHTDHVHISLTRAGGAMQTSYWTGKVTGPSVTGTASSRSWLLPLAAFAAVGSSVAFFYSSGAPNWSILQRRHFLGRRR